MLSKRLRICCDLHKQIGLWASEGECISQDRLNLSAEMSLALPFIIQFADVTNSN